ncbi:DNA mismatch repair endonuclease MutL [Microcoleus sp. FACHB-1515]|uniref:DNA mismatch repair endonuclease MutL n=1 Tax=Cyanophyceae TaxID=3028117 RepID=UPI0016883B3D|nr:DNA mismatch repair endonuclease MutL [Microcoleus sp. FACHB-1515]MBD2089855.1 DNA mismatch repair endonuclease MutL [Microcoleus sp. FACHB-1515]
MASIQPLPKEVIHLIAAGEVIDSLAAVVRELVENAIDAQATRISIALWPEQWRVRVSDNGCGMSLTDLKQAATAHSTSKISSSRDLWCIHSLGFRGEALHSLAQLADLEICSRAADEPDGYQISYDHQGHAETIAPIAIAAGSIVTVSNLFATLPTRRQGVLPAQQWRSVQTMIQNLALCHPQITWQIEQNDRPWLSLWAGGTAKQILPQLLREVQPTDLGEYTQSITVDGEYSTAATASLYVLAGLPDRCHRHRPDWIRIAVNGRMVRLPELEQAVFSAFRRTLPRDRHPVCLLHLRTQPDQIDWNRHPAKAEIFLHHLSAWQTAAKSAIEQTLSSALLPDAAHVERVTGVIKAAEAGGVYGSSRSIPEPEPEPEKPLIELKAIAQVHGMYVLVEHPTGMWLIEQHIAHERILYEQLCDRWEIVPLEPPMILEQLSPLQREQLQRVGLEVEPFGDRLWAVRSAPAVLSGRSDCADALLELSQGGDLESALVATACRTAIRNGISLTPEAMQTLVDQWQQTRHPHTCPHGRPIYLSLEESSLSKFFRRHWVIGKSHGI